MCIWLLSVFCKRREKNIADISCADDLTACVSGCYVIEDKGYDRYASNLKVIKIMCNSKFNIDAVNAPIKDHPIASDILKELDNNKATEVKVLF